MVDRTSASDPVAHAAVPWTEGRDVWYHDLVDDQPDTHAYELHDAEDPLFIIYTSGTTGKPKGLVHTMGGYLQTAYTPRAAVRFAAGLRGRERRAAPR